MKKEMKKEMKKRTKKVRFFHRCARLGKTTLCLGKVSELALLLSSFQLIGVNVSGAGCQGIEKGVNISIPFEYNTNIFLFLLGRLVSRILFYLPLIPSYLIQVPYRFIKILYSLFNLRQQLPQKSMKEKKKKRKEKTKRHGGGRRITFFFF